MGWVDVNLVAKGSFLDEIGALLTGTKNLLLNLNIIHSNQRKIWIRIAKS